MGDEAAGQEFGSILNITGSVLINLGNNLMSSGQQGGGESTPVTKRRGSSDDYEGVEMDETGDSKASSTNGKGGVPRRDSSEHVELTLSPRLGDDYVDGDEWETGPDELGEFHHRDGAGNVLDRQNSSDVDGLMTGVPNSTATGTSPSKAIKIVLKNGVKAVKNGQCPAPPPPSWSNASALWRRLKLCVAAVLAWLLPLLQVVHTVAWRMIETVRPAWCNRWFLGCVFFGIGTVLVFVSYSFAPQSLLAPLGAVQFVSNVGFARCIHGATVTKRMIYATCVIVFGIFLVFVYSSNENPHFDVVQLKELYGYKAFQGYATTLGASLLILHGTYRWYRRQHRKGHPLPFDGTLRPLTYGMFSAIVGTQSTLQAKCLSELLSQAVRVYHGGPGGQPLSEWFTYFTLVLWLSTTAFWLYRMNKALALFDPLFIIPVLQVFWTFFATMNGGIYFREFFTEDFKHNDVPGFVTGILVIFIGVYLLSPEPKLKEGPKIKEVTISGKGIVGTSGGGGVDGSGGRASNGAGKQQQQQQQQQLAGSDGGAPGAPNGPVGSPNTRAADRRRKASPRRTYPTFSTRKMRMTFAASTLSPFNAASAMGGANRESEHTPRLVSFGGDMPMMQSSTAMDMLNLVPDLGEGSDEEFAAL